MSRSARRASISPTAAIRSGWPTRPGRGNLRNGIAPPDSSHPKFHNCAGAIDYQIEADYSGLIAPGMPDVVIALGEKFGRLMNYGDGVYAGQFMGAMYAEAFFEKDVMKLIEAGLRAIPPESLYAGMVRDMLQWHKENPTELGEDLGAGREEVQPGQELQYQRTRREARGRLGPDGPALRQRRPRPDDDHLVPVRIRQRLQSVLQRRHPVHHSRHLEPARQVLSQARRDEDLQPHGLQLPEAAGRLRETGPPGPGASRRANREGRQW